MIVIKEFPNKQFSNKEDMFKALRENKKTLIAQKKMVTKHSDPVYFTYIPMDSKGEVIKAEIADIMALGKGDNEWVKNGSEVLSYLQLFSARRYFKKRMG